MQDEMNNLSHHIEKYILDLFNDEQEENFISLRRKELAEMFDCVPSQINYVLRSRFGPEKGYLIESRRGEYGYIKIFRVTYSDFEEKSLHINSLVGDKISMHDACRLLEALADRGFLTDKERLLIEIALKNSTLHEPKKTARLLKKMLIGLIGIEDEEEE